MVFNVALKGGKHRLDPSYSIFGVKRPLKDQQKEPKWLKMGIFASKCTSTLSSDTKSFSKAFLIILLIFEAFPMFFSRSHGGPSALQHLALAREGR